jgi:hypothetical protein
VKRDSERLPPVVRDLLSHFEGLTECELEIVDVFIDGVGWISNVTSCYCDHQDCINLPIADGFADEFHTYVARVEDVRAYRCRIPPSRK